MQMRRLLRPNLHSSAPPVSTFCSMQTSYLRPLSHTPDTMRGECSGKAMVGISGTMATTSVTLGRVCSSKKRGNILCRAQYRGRRRVAARDECRVREASRHCQEIILAFLMKQRVLSKLAQAKLIGDVEMQNEIQEQADEICEIFDVMWARHPRETSDQKARREEMISTGAVVLQCKAALNQAIANEDYDEAAKLKEDLEKAQADSAKANKEMGSVTAAPQYKFSLGSVVTHKKDGWHGMICGFDPVCQEGTKWRKRMELSEKEAQQPFYFIIVCEMDSPPPSHDGHEGTGIIAYCAEESIESSPNVHISSHFVYHLFLGATRAGPLLPTLALRDLMQSNSSTSGS